jgi:hypothetical protein
MEKKRGGRREMKCLQEKEGKIKSWNVFEKVRGYAG